MLSPKNPPLLISAKNFKDKKHLYILLIKNRDSTKNRNAADCLRLARPPEPREHTENTQPNKRAKKRPEGADCKELHRWLPFALAFSHHTTMRIPLASLALASVCVAQPPLPIADLGMGLRVLATHSLDLGQRCDAIRDGSGHPMLVWANEQNSALQVVKDRAAVLAWLTQHATALGQAGFTPAFARTGSWRGCDAWANPVARSRTLSS